MNNREPGVYVQSVKEPCVGEKDATRNKELFQKERKIILELHSKSETFGEYWNIFPLLLKNNVSKDANSVFPIGSKIIITPWLYQTRG